jgi:murein DD-endopeptidase MepM/ murein hydrolase activator NlpD
MNIIHSTLMMKKAANSMKQKRIFKGELNSPATSKKSTTLISAAIASAALLGGVLLFSGSEDVNATQETPSIPNKASEHYNIELALPDYQAKQVNLNEEKQSDDWQSFTVKNGDNLAMIFDRAGLSPRQLHNLLSLNKNAKKTLTRVKPGQEFKLRINAAGELDELVYQQSETHAFKAKREGEVYIFNSNERQYEHRATYAKGVIDSSLFESAKDAGLSENLTMDLAYIFGWDVDFALDIREGDRFTVVYEELFLDGKKVGDGNILSAEFVNQGHSYKAVRYEDPKGNASYYTPEGRSMRKAFLRTPVSLARISSRFGKRHHPTLKRTKQHKGVDYAAPRGTPIKATGDGKIVWRGRKGGYGKTIVLDHGNNYTTLYAHMNNYSRKFRSGSRVKQGDIIGFIGSTGRSTGPHLHYEFRVSGHHRNPLTVKLPKASPVNKKHREDFELKARSWLVQLDLASQSNIAMLDL